MKIGDPITVCVRRKLNSSGSMFALDFRRGTVVKTDLPSTVPAIVYNYNQVLSRVRLSDENVTWTTGHGDDIDKQLDTIQRLLA